MHGAFALFFSPCCMLHSMLQILVRNLFQWVFCFFQLNCYLKISIFTHRTFYFYFYRNREKLFYVQYETKTPQRAHNEQLRFRMKVVWRTAVVSFFGFSSLPNTQCFGMNWWLNKKFQVLCNFLCLVVGVRPCFSSSSSSSSMRHS